MDIDGIIDVIPVAAVLTGLYTYTPHDARKWIVDHDLLEGLVVIAGLGVRHPGLDVFTGRTGAVAGRHEIHEHGLSVPIGTGAFRVTRQVDRFGDIRVGHERRVYSPWRAHSKVAGSIVGVSDRFHRRG